jgi:nucleotide-binding universal stress UspA family protein
MERQLHAQAEGVRQIVSALAQRAGVRWSFEVTRGTLAHEIARAAGEGDLVALGVTRRTVFAGAFGLGPTAPRRQEPERQKRPVLALFTGSAASTRALKLAATFAETLQRPLSVLLVAKDDASLTKLKEDAQALVKPRDVRFRRLIDPTVAAVRDAAEAERAEVLLIEQGATTLDSEAVRMLNDELSCPSLIVR